MLSRIWSPAIALVLWAVLPNIGQAKQPPKFQPVATPEIQTIRFGQQSFAAAVQCTAASVDTLAYRMDGWVTGNELYKAYIDPALQCTNPYPYTITSVAMMMYIAKGSSINLSVDIELVDTSNPSCTAPGEVLTVSSEYTYAPTSSGYRTIFIPLDTPVTVNGPFFAGFFFANSVPATDSLGLLLDAHPYHCQSYNLWDTALGFIDLTNFPSIPPFDPSWNFPGRLAMEVAGTPGGSSGNACCQITPVTTTDFGRVDYPQQEDLQFTVTNCGTTTLNATASEPCPAFSLPSGGGSFSLGAGQSRTVTIRFIPPSDGEYSCTVDLGNTACGSITFTGTSGAPQPTPKPAWLFPAANSTLLGKTKLWIEDTSGSQILDYASFEYSTGGSFTEIGRDYDGHSPLRDGVTTVEAADGYSLDWDFSALPKGNYTLRATLHDTHGRASSVTLPVYLEPMPALPVITSPANGSDLCSPLHVFMTSSDATMQQAQVSRLDANSNYSNAVGTLDQHLLGDANGHPADGNYAFNGEFGDYYSGPAAAALLAKQWYDKGYTQIMSAGAGTMTVTAAAESLATAFGTRVAKGTTDEQMYSGLVAYAASRGNQFKFDFVRDPDYFDLRTWAEDEQRGVILGLSGTPGFWVALSGFSGWKLPNGNYQVVVSDPLMGNLQTGEYSYVSQFPTLYIDGDWHRVDIAISMTPTDWTVSHQAIGTDANKNDGWSVPFDPSGLVEGDLYFLKAVGTDPASHSGSSAVLTRYTCTATYANGDYNGDQSADLSDLTILLQFIANHKNPPEGGAMRADCNCDQQINMADVIYYINYLFGTATAPCR